MVSFFYANELNKVISAGHVLPRNYVLCLRNSLSGSCRDSLSILPFMMLHLLFLLDFLCKTEKFFRFFFVCSWCCPRLVQSSVICLKAPRAAYGTSSFLSDLVSTPSPNAAWLLLSIGILTILRSCVKSLKLPFYKGFCYNYHCRKGAFCEPFIA